MILKKKVSLSNFENETTEDKAVLSHYVHANLNEITEHYKTDAFHSVEQLFADEHLISSEINQVLNDLKSEKKSGAF